MEKHITKKRIMLYLLLMYAFLLTGWIFILKYPNAYVIVWGLFSIFPILATVITRKASKDRSPWLLKPEFKRNWRVYIFSSLAPGVAIIFGAAAFFFLFPNDLDFSGMYIVEIFSRYGAPPPLHLQIGKIIWISNNCSFDYTHTDFCDW